MDKRNLTIIGALAVVAIVVILFFTLRPKTQTPIVQPPQTAQTPIVQETPAPKLFEFLIKGKKLAKPEQTIKVTEGEDVLFKITSDEVEEFHLHGYDISKDLEPNQSVEIQFKADKTGRFEFELEKSKITLGALEVLPK